MSTLCEDVPETQDVPDLVPARMLNEFTYCPRLAYLEWVQGEFADNLETREGRFGHRRVDHADRKQFPDEPSPPAPLPEGEGSDAEGDSPIFHHPLLLSINDRRGGKLGQSPAPAPSRGSPDPAEADFPPATPAQASTSAAVPMYEQASSGVVPFFFQ